MKIKATFQGAFVLLAAALMLGSQTFAQSAEPDTSLTYSCTNYSVGVGDSTVQLTGTDTYWGTTHVSTDTITLTPSQEPTTTRKNMDVLSIIMAIATIIAIFTGPIVASRLTERTQSRMQEQQNNWQKKWEAEVEEKRRVWEVQRIEAMQGLEERWKLVDRDRSNENKESLKKMADALTKIANK